MSRSFAVLLTQEQLLSKAMSQLPAKGKILWPNMLGNRMGCVLRQFKPFEILQASHNHSGKEDTFQGDVDIQECYIPAPSRCEI